MADEIKIPEIAITLDTNDNSAFANIAETLTDIEDLDDDNGIKSQSIRKPKLKIKLNTADDGAVTDLEDLETSDAEINEAKHVSFKNVELEQSEEVQNCQKGTEGQIKQLLCFKDNVLFNSEKDYLTDVENFDTDDEVEDNQIPDISGCYDTFQPDYIEDSTFVTVEKDINVPKNTTNYLVCPEVEESNLTDMENLDESNDELKTKKVKPKQKKTKRCHKMKKSASQPFSNEHQKCPVIGFQFDSDDDDDENKNQLQFPICKKVTKNMRMVLTDTEDLQDDETFFYSKTKKVNSKQMFQNNADTTGIHESQDFITNDDGSDSQNSTDNESLEGYKDTYAINSEISLPPSNRTLILLHEDKSIVPTKQILPLDEETKFGLKIDEEDEDLTDIENYPDELLDLQEYLSLRGPTPDICGYEGSTIEEEESDFLNRKKLENSGYLTPEPSFADQDSHRDIEHTGYKDKNQLTVSNLSTQEINESHTDFEEFSTDDEDFAKSCSKTKKHHKFYNNLTNQNPDKSPNLTDCEDLNLSAEDNHLLFPKNKKVRHRKSKKNKSTEVTYLKGGSYDNYVGNTFDVNCGKENVFVNFKNGSVCFGVNKEWDATKKSPKEDDTQEAKQQVDATANFVTYESVLLKPDCNMPIPVIPNPVSYKQIDEMLEKMLVEVDRQERLFSLDLDVLEPTDDLYLNKLEIVPTDDTIIEIPLKKTKCYSTFQEIQIDSNDDANNKIKMDQNRLNKAQFYDLNKSDVFFKQSKIASNELLNNDEYLDAVIDDDQKTLEHHYEPIEYNALTNACEKFDYLPDTNIWFEGTFRNLSVVPEEDEDESVSLLSKFSTTDLANKYSFLEANMTEYTDESDDSTDNSSNESSFENNEGIIKAEVKLLVKTADEEKETIEIRSVRKMLDKPFNSGINKKVEIERKLSTFKNKISSIVNRKNTLEHISNENLVPKEKKKPSFTFQQLFVRTSELNENNSISKKKGSRSDLIATSSTQYPLQYNPSIIQNVDLHANIPFVPCYSNYDASEYSSKPIICPHTNPFTETISNPFNESVAPLKAYCNWLEDINGGISTTTEQLVASNEELMLDKPLGQPLLTGLSDIDDNVAVDLDTTITKTNAFIQSESQLEYDDNEQTTTKKTISDRKSDDNKNNLNEKKKSKKGFFGSIKTFVEKSFESDSDSEKSPKRNKKIKKVKKGKEVKDAPAILPRKPKLPTPPLEPLDIQSIPYVEALDSDLPPSHKPPDIPQEQVKTLVFDDSKTDQSPILKNDLPKTESPVDSSKKVKCTTIITEEVSKTIAPLVLEAEEFSVIVDPTNQELPKKSTETFTINIDESIEKIEKEILEKSPILSDEKIVKPWADLDFTADIVPMPSPQFRDNIYEDVETPLVSIPSDDIIHSKLRRVSYKEEPEEIVDKITENDVYEKSEKDVSKSKKVGFFNLFKKRNSKELSDGKKHPLSEAVLKDMLDSNKFLDDEIQNYHDVYPSVETLKKLSKKEEESGIKDNELEIAVEETVEEKGTSTRLFGLFKKSVLIDESKQTEESVLEESNESSGLFGLFKKTKKDQPATKLILSEDVATDINSTNVFFKTKKEVYDDNIPPLSTTISILSEKVDNGTKSELQDITNVITNDYETKNIDISEEIDTTKSEIGKETKTTVEDLNQQIILKQEEAPLITSRSRDPSPKPSGFFGLFKKSKKDDVAAEKLIPEAALREISDTHQFVKHEVNMYHDVKPSQFDLVLPMSGSDEEIDLTIAAPEVFNQRETEQISNDLVPNVNKISERLENRINDTTDFLSKEREKYDNVEPDTFSPIKKTVENEVEVLPKSNRGILGIFKKSKDDSNDIAEDVLISESVEKADSQHKKMESSPKSTKGFFSRIKKSKDELSDTEKDEKPNEKLSDKQDIESSPKSSKGLFSRLKKVKTDSFEILPQESKITVQESENKTETVMDTTQTIVHDPKEKQDNVTEITISSSKVIKTEPTESKKIFGVFTKSKEDPDKTISVVPSEFKEDIITSNDFLTQEVKYFNDVKPEKFEKVLIDEHKIEQTAKKSSPKPSKGIFGIFKKSKDESVENTTVFSEESQQNISSTKNFLNEEVVRFEDVKPEKFHEVKIDEQPIINDQITENSSPKPSKGIFGIFKKSKDEFVEDTILPLEIQTDENFSKKDVPDNFDKINIHEDAIKSDQTTEKSTKPYKSLFGILKKTKDESVDGTLISSVESQKDINISKDFLTEEVKSFEDVKPAKFDQIQLDDANKVDQMTEKSLSKPSKGIFGIFKKSKDETLEETPVLSLESQKDIVSSEDMLINEVTHIVEVKPEKFDIVKIDEHAIKNDQTLVKLSPNPSKGIFSMFKKTKDETVEGKPISSVESQNEIIISKDFLTKEVKSFEDVKPEKFDQIQIDEDAIKVDQTTEKCLPKPSKGIFGIFKKSKDESLAETPIFSVESQKDIVSLEDVLPKVEVKAENLDNAKVDEYTIKNDQILEKSSPIPSKSIFGMFKKSKKEDNKDVENNDEHTLKNRQVCNDFLLKEVDVYHDVKPEKFEIIQIKDISEKTEITSKANKSVFGIFKKYKKDETNEPCATDLVLKEMHDSNEFLSKEIENYHDVRPEITLTIPSEEELSTKAAKETSSNFFGIFTKSKKENDDHKVENEVIIDDDPIDKAIVLDVQTTEEIKLIKEEPKTGFLSKFKVSKKRISEEEKSKEINDQIINTTDFIATEVKNYEDGVLETVRPVSNEEFKTADFQSVIKDKLHQSLKSDDQVSLQLKEISENIMITGDASRQVEEIASEYEKEVSPEKDKQSKDKEKKGFFNIFGKKFKSQDGIEDETKEKQEDETLRKKQKQKRRKSSSPFKFFSKKSEDEGTPPKETVSATKLQEAKIAGTIQPVDDLMNVEFKEQIENTLTDEVLSSLDEKLQNLKISYTPAKIKEMHDCRDFLFIEVDNYDHGKSVVVTDIDKDLENQSKANEANISVQLATTTVDDIIEIAKNKVLEDAEILEVQQPNVPENVEIKIKQTSKPGFFSKLGNFISGKIDDTADDISKSKETVITQLDESEKVLTDKIKDTQIKVDTDTKNMKESSSSKAKEIIKSVKNVQEEAYNTLEQQITKVETKVEEVDETIIESLSVEDKMKNIEALQVDNTIRELINNTANKGDVLQKSMDEKLKDIEDKMDDTKKVFAQKTTEAIEHAQLESQQSRDLVAAKITNLTENVTKQKDTIKETVDNFIVKKELEIEQKEKVISKEIQDKRKEITLGIDSIQKDIQDEDLKQLKDVVFEGTIIKTGVADVIIKSDEVVKKVSSDIVKIKESISKNGVEILDNLDTDVRTIENKTEETRNNLVQTIAKSTDDLKIKPTSILNNMVIKDTQQALTSETKHAQHLIEQKATSTKDILIESLSQKIDTIDTGKEKLEFVRSDVKPEEIRADVVSRIQSVEEDKLKLVDNEIEKLTMALGPKSKPDVKISDNIPSYVTSPTFARRTVSQKYSKDERPAAVEVICGKLQDNIEATAYTVTEPDDTPEEGKRKPLFHLESEDDDLNDAKLRQRSDSCKSNVLETLTDKKLNNLLTSLDHSISDLKDTQVEEKITEAFIKAEQELELIKKDSKADVDQIEQKLLDLDKALENLEQTSDSKLERKLHRVERKFERMASEVIDEKDANDETSPTKVEAQREHDFQKLVSQLSTEEVSDFQKEYSHLWDETTFSKSEEWNSKTPDSQADIQDLPQGEIVYMAPVTLNKDNLVNKAGIEVDVIPIMKSPCQSPKPTKKNKRAKSAMDFYEAKLSNVEFDRGSLPDLEATPQTLPIKRSLVNTILQLNPDRFLRSSTSSLRSNTSSSVNSDLSKGDIMSAVLDWLEKSSPIVESHSLASSCSSLSYSKSNIPTICINNENQQRVESNSLSKETTSSSTITTLTEENKTIPLPKPRFVKEPQLALNKIEEVPQTKPEKQISPVRDDLLDEEFVPETYSDKKKFWENVANEPIASKRTTIHEILPSDKDLFKKQRAMSVQEIVNVPTPRPRLAQVSHSIDEDTLKTENDVSVESFSRIEQLQCEENVDTKVLVAGLNESQNLDEEFNKIKPKQLSFHKEEESPIENKIMTEYQASFMAPSEMKQKSPPKVESDSSDSESDNVGVSSSANDNAGYISDSGDVEHYISDSEIEDRVPQIRERLMSMFQPPVAAVRKSIYERSASLPTEDLYEVSARSIQLRKQYYEEQIKKEMIEEQLTSELEEEPSPERKTLFGTLLEQSSEDHSSLQDIAQGFDKSKRQSADEVADIQDFMEITEKKEVSFVQTHKPEIKTHIEEHELISTQKSETHKEIDHETHIQRFSTSSDQSSSSEKGTKDGSISKPDSMEVHVDKSEIEDSEKLAELDQDATDIEVKSIDSLNAADLSPKSLYFVEDPIPEIIFTLSGKQRRISEESDEYAPKTEKIVESPINVPKEHTEDTVWEVSVQSQPESRFEEKATSFDAVVAEKIEKDDELSISTRDESDLGSEIHQDHSDSTASDKIKSDSHNDIERIIIDSLQHQKVDPTEAKALAGALIEEIEAEIQRRECLPKTNIKTDVSDYLKYLAETKGLDAREVELVESVLARRRRELSKLSRGDTQASSMEITDEDLRYSGSEFSDASHVLEQQISLLKAEKLDDLRSISFLDKIDEKQVEESYQSKDYESYNLDGSISKNKTDLHAKTLEGTTSKKSVENSTVSNKGQTVVESTAFDVVEKTTVIEAIATEKAYTKQADAEIDEHKTSYVDLSKQHIVDKTLKENEIQTDDGISITTQDKTVVSDEIKSFIKHEIDFNEQKKDDKINIKGEIACEDLVSTENISTIKTINEIKELEDGVRVEKIGTREETQNKTFQKEVIDKKVEENYSRENEDITVLCTKTSSTTSATDVHHQSAVTSLTTEKIETISIDPAALSSTIDGTKIVVETHKEVKRSSSSDSKSSVSESVKSPDDQFSSCSSGRKGDSDTSKTVEKPEVLLRKTTSVQKPDRKSGLEFESYSSSGESHYHSFEVDSGKSRPCSSDVEGLVAAGSSEYESALTSQDISARSHVTSTEYHTAVSSISSKESMKSLDSDSSGNLGSIEVSEVSETLVPSTEEIDGDMLDTVDQQILEDDGWTQPKEMIESEKTDTQSKMKRSCEMTFQPEPKLLTSESPQSEDKKIFASMDESLVSMSLSSTSATEPQTVIELSRTDSERGGMTVSEQISIAGSCDSLVSQQGATTGATIDMSTSTGFTDGNLQIESITFTTSVIDEKGIRSVSTQVTSECQIPEEGPQIKSDDDVASNGSAHTEMKKKGHRRQESTSFVPTVLTSPKTKFEHKIQSDLTESDKYTGELSSKEFISDEKKDVDEKEKEESYETEADQGFHQDVRNGKYKETEIERKDDTPELSSETQASIGELVQEFTSALARSPEIKKLHFNKEQLEKRDSHGKSSSTSSEKSSFEEAEAEAAFNMVAHISPAHKIKQICPILEDEDAEKHELETRERAQKEFEEKRRAQIRDQSPGSIPDIKVTQHMTPLVDRNFHYPDLELEAEERRREKEAEAHQSTPQTPSSKSSEDTDQGREYVLEDSGVQIPEETATESKCTVIEQTIKEDADKDTDSPNSANSDSFEMLEKPDLIDDFVVIEEVAKEAHEFDSEGKSVEIESQSKGKRGKKHDEEVEAYLTHSAPTPLTRISDVKYFPDGSSSDELGFEFEDSPPINNDGTATSYDQELEANKKWIEQQFQGDQAARIAAGYDYDVEFERGPLEDIKEEDINDFDPTSSRIGSLGSQKESGGSLGSVKDSYSSTPEYDVLAGRKYFTRSGEHDDVSMSSLQEFETLERAMSLENRRAHQGSQDSSNGSFKTRYYASKSGQGDDVSVSSLKEFEGLEMACIAAHKIEVKAEEEEAILGQIDEGQESLASESESLETVSHTDKKIIGESDEEDYEKRMFEIDEIIRQAQTNVERFIDLKEGEKTESLGRGDSIEEVSKVPELEMDTPLARASSKVQWKETETMITSTDSIDGKIDKGESQHDSTDSLDQKTGADIMTASTDSIEFQSRKTEPINLLSDSIEIKDEACGGMIASDSLELAAHQKQTTDDEMLESTDSLVDLTSSTACTHATYQYETDSVFSGSFTSGGSNTMVSSTDTIEPVQVDIATAARKVWFDQDAGSSQQFTTEYLCDTGKPYVTEVIEPCEGDEYSHTIHRRVELPPEVKKITFTGKDADERLQQFIDDFNEGEHVDETEEVDEAGNVHTKRVVQKRFIVKGDPEESSYDMLKKSLASKTNRLTKTTTGEETGAGSVATAAHEGFKAHANRRRQLRYEISVEDQIEVDPREHDWRFNLPKHVEGEEAAGTEGVEHTDTKDVADQHQLSDEMKELLKELERESKQ